MLHSLSGTVTTSEAVQKDTGRVIRKLADQCLVMKRGEIAMRQRGKHVGADGVRQQMSI